MNIKNKKKKLVIGCVAGAVVLAAAGWSVLAKGGKNTVISNTTSSAVGKMDISKSIQGTGVITAENSTNIKVTTGIRIIEVRVRTGDEVNAGDVLAITDANSVTAELLGAKEKLNEVDKKLKKANRKKAEYYNLAKSRQNLLEKIDVLNVITQTNSILAPANGTLSAVNGAAGEVQKSTGNQGNQGSNTSGNNASENNKPPSIQQQSSETDSFNNMTVGLHETGESDKLAVRLNETGESDKLTVRLNETGESNKRIVTLNEEGNHTEKPQEPSQPNKPVIFIKLPEMKLGTPVTGQPQIKDLKETEYYMGTIEWNKPADVYEPSTVYAARITLSAKPGYSFEKGAEPKAEGAAVSDVVYTGEETVRSVAFTAIYPETTAEIPKVEKPEEEKPEEEKPEEIPEEEKPEQIPEDEKNPSENGECNKPSEDENDTELPASEAVEPPSVNGGDFDASAGGAAVVAGGSSGAASGSEDKEVNTELVTVFSIASGDKMKVGIQVDEMDILSVSQGQKSTITLNALSGTTFEGQIANINKVGAANNGVTKYPVEITVAKDERMLSGMNVSATVLVEEKKNVLAVPAAAVMEESGKSYVYTSVDGKTGELTGKKEVTTGLTDGTNIEITKGMKEGTEIHYLIPESSNEGMDEAETMQNEMM